MSDPRLSAINQMRSLDTQLLKPSEQKEAPEISFKDMMSKYISDANDMQVSADKDIQKIIAGEDVDAHQVMTAVEKANISFELVMEIRNKMLEAYREIMKSQL